MSFLKDVLQNTSFFVQFILVVAVVFLLAYFVEKQKLKKEGTCTKVITTKKLALIGLFSAISALLMLFEFPVFFAPFFYKLDFSEVPILILGFAYGPVVAVLSEFCKILLKLFLKSTTTAFVGELANFMVGVSFILPASLLYLYKKTKKMAVLSTLLGTIVMTVFGSLLNSFYLLPKFAIMYGISIDTIVDMGKVVNPKIDSISKLVLYAVVPLNLLKGVLISTIASFVYKKIRKII